jgi:hypothetical protein
MVVFITMGVSDPYGQKASARIAANLLYRLVAHTACAHAPLPGVAMRQVANNKKRKFSAKIHFARLAL